jgi:hypothetical protein
MYLFNAMSFYDRRRWRIQTVLALATIFGPSFVLALSGYMMPWPLVEP